MPLVGLSAALDVTRFQPDLSESRSPPFDRRTNVGEAAEQSNELSSVTVADVGGNVRCAFVCFDVNNAVAVVFNNLL